MVGYDGGIGPTCIKALYSTYILRTDGVLIWENNASSPETILDASTGNPLAGILNVQEGQYHGCAAVSTGTAECWQTNAASGNLTFCQALDGAKCDQIAEAVEPFTPASARANELQPFPVAKTARLNSQNAPCFSARVALSQARRSPASEELCRTIMHPLSIRRDALCCGNVWKSNWTRVDRCPGQ